MRNLNIAFVTPEAVPFAKTGGLADISGVLPLLFAQRGHTVKLFMPKYRPISDNSSDLHRLNIETICTVGSKEYKAQFYKQVDRRTGLEIIFIANNQLFDRENLYRDPATNNDYTDNDDRFIFFCKTVLQLLKELQWKPNIIHTNDWQTALIPSYLKTAYRNDSFFQSCRTVFTIHNLAYQGQFPADTYKKIDLDQSYFYPAAPFEFWGKVNFVKAAITLADHVTTVSPTYALEIQKSSDYGMGLEGVLAERTVSLSGILNGVEYDVWSPQKDKLIPFKYFPANLSGKKRNKLELLRQAQLPLRMEQPLIGMISRLDNQKGLDLIETMMDKMMELPLQFILLGTGEEKYHTFFRTAENKYPDKIKAYLKFDDAMAHLIEAGADIFLMPSRYEPCGLNQMYSLKYGTVPIVRRTGGLADTVIDFNENTLEGTGFVFEDYNALNLLKTIKGAVDFFGRKRVWCKIVKRGMRQDFSWQKSAEKYLQLYYSLLD